MGHTIARTRHLCCSSSETPPRQSRAERGWTQNTCDAPQEVAGRDEPVLAGEHGAGLAAALQLTHDLHQPGAVGRRDLQRGEIAPSMAESEPHRPRRRASASAARRVRHWVRFTGKILSGEAQTAFVESESFIRGKNVSSSPAGTRTHAISPSRAEGREGAERGTHLKLRHLRRPAAV